MSMMFSGSKKDTWSEGTWERVESENEQGKFSFAVFCPSPPTISTNKNKKEWVDLTAAEVKILRNASNNDREFAALVIARFKEKNT